MAKMIESECGNEILLLSNFNLFFGFITSNENISWQCTKLKLFGKSIGNKNEVLSNQSI